jgi:ankyrin repeat protein
MMISDRFRWAYCQLDSLRRLGCIPSSIRKALDELPTTLDDTYERALQGIPKEKWHHAQRLFQCLVAAVRPLRVKELAEVLTLNFDSVTAPGLLEGWRPENPEEALLSTCSTLIAIAENAGSKIIQFSHFSVKEYLTSDRLRNFKVGNLCDFHISLDAAHTTLARACLAVLLQLDEHVDKRHLATFPLAFYAAQHWINHAEFKGVEMRIQNDMECLFNPRKPYLAAWVWVHDVDPDSRRSGFWARAKRPSPPKATALYYASLCGFGRLADYLICTHGEDINAESSCRRTPLHAASYKGHAETVRVLLYHGANMNATDEDKKTPLCSAYDGGHLEVMRLLLERGVDVDVEHGYSGPILHYASGYGQVEVVHLLLQHGADVNSKDYYDSTPLYEASRYGHPRVVQLLLNHRADVNALTMDHETPLCTATGLGSLEVVKLLLRHGADMSIRDDDDRTPYQIARSRGFTEVAQLLLDYGAKA